MTYDISNKISNRHYKRCFFQVSRQEPKKCIVLNRFQSFFADDARKVLRELPNWQLVLADQHRGNSYLRLKRLVGYAKAKRSIHQAIFHKLSSPFPDIFLQTYNVCMYVCPLPMFVCSGKHNFPCISSGTRNVRLTNFGNHQ